MTDSDEACRYIHPQSHRLFLFGYILRLVSLQQIAFDLVLNCCRHAMKPKARQSRKRSRTTITNTLIDTSECSEDVSDDASVYEVSDESDSESERGARPTKRTKCGNKTGPERTSVAKESKSSDSRSRTSNRTKAGESNKERPERASVAKESKTSNTRSRTSNKTKAGASNKEGSPSSEISEPGNSRCVQSLPMSNDEESVTSESQPSTSQNRDVALPESPEQSSQIETSERRKKRKFTLINRKENNRWKTCIKEHFIKAFQECVGDTWFDVGPPDIDLCERILEKYPENPGISSHDIQYYIRNVCTLERRRQYHQCTEIDKWIEVIEALSPDDNEVAKQLGLVLTVAKQEPPDESPMPDTFDRDLPLPNYDAIYDYFSRAFSNQPLPELTPMDSLVVEDCMQSLAFQVESLSDSELRKSLRKVYLCMVQDPDKDPELDQEGLKEQLMENASILNPFGLNAQAIVPVPPK